MPDLCYSRNASNDFLTSHQIRARAPAVYAHDYAEDLSNKYGNFNSAQAIEVMNDYGYGVTQAAQVNGRTELANMHGQHLMAFAKRHEINAFSEQQPDIIFYISRDGVVVSGVVLVLVLLALVLMVLLLVSVLLVVVLLSLVLPAVQANVARRWCVRRGSWCRCVC